MRTGLVLAGGLGLVAVLWLFLGHTREDHEPAELQSDRVELAAPTQPAEKPETLENAAAREPVVATPSPPREPPVALADGDTIRGVVLRPDGTPMPQCTVLLAWDEKGQVHARSARSGVDGAFAFEVGAGVRGDLLASTPDHTPAYLRDVATGTSGIELRLGPSDPMRLEVTEPGGRVLEGAKATFLWQLAGHMVVDPSGFSMRSAKPDVWQRPPVPFSVRVRPYGHGPAELGPLDPEQVGPVLRIVVEPLPHVRGRVVHAGEPVADAQVSFVVLAEGEAPRVFTVVAARTDASGAFDAFQPRPGRYALEAVHRPLGEGRSAPIVLDGASDVEGVVIDLATPLGAIEGRVLLPAGHEPAELSLRASAARGYRTLRADGTFLLPDLRVGPCRIELLAGLGDEGPDQWIHMSDGPTRAPTWLRTEPTFVVEVRPGATTHLEIDLATPAPCRLACTIHLDGEAPALREGFHPGWGRPEPSVVLDRGNAETRLSATDPDAQGAFELSALEPITGRLRIELPLDGSYETWRIEDEVTLVAGVTPWNLDVATGSLFVDFPGERASDGLEAEWHAPGGASVRVIHPTLDEHRRHAFFEHVPGGRVRLSKKTDAERHVDVEVTAGERNEASWPF